MNLMTGMSNLSLLATILLSEIRLKTIPSSWFQDNLLPQPSSLDTYVPTTDKWDEDESMIPYEPTSEEGTMEQLDEFIGAYIPL